jgi:hypothetical protein
MGLLYLYLILLYELFPILRIILRDIFIHVHTSMGTAVAQWLRYCATNQNVAGSILDGVKEFFIDLNPSDRTMALGSTQSLTKVSTRCISRG